MGRGNECKNSFAHSQDVILKKSICKIQSTHQEHTCVVCRISTDKIIAPVSISTNISQWWGNDTVVIAMKLLLIKSNHEQCILWLFHYCSLCILKLVYTITMLFYGTSGPYHDKKGYLHLFNAQCTVQSVVLWTWKLLHLTLKWIH